jgi:hypothetical protein
MVNTFTAIGHLCETVLQGSASYHLCKVSISCLKCFFFLDTIISVTCILVNAFQPLFYPDILYPTW